MAAMRRLCSASTSRSVGSRPWAARISSRSWFSWRTRRLREIIPEAGDRWRSAQARTVARARTCSRPSQLEISSICAGVASSSSTKVTASMATSCSTSSRCVA
ncbi:hypothetical protein ACFFX0_09540 [Citricoccus parietis]|uniref:Uncharacterized protein n=1 Tax=Citricoccus parietis TaxID=592307 RepID=A0ABV5FXN5_9MICC